LFFVNRILNNKKLESILEDIVDRQQKIEKKPIELDELLKYSDYNYYENNSSKNKFKKYLKRKNLSDETIEEIILNISKMYRLGNSFIGTTFEMLQEYDVEITEENMQEILGYLTDIYNNTRIWTNNGWTPIEMKKM
jgi:hypothetical protein